MLTPIDIQNHSLKTAVRGYSKKETDDFLDEILKGYEELYKENRDLKDKVTFLSEGIQYYKQMETTLQKALVLAEKTSAETQDAAKSKADAMMNEAQARADAILKEAQAKAEAVSKEAEAEAEGLRKEIQAYSEITKSKANRELEDTRNHVRKLVQSYENYRLQFKKLAESQIEMLESEHYSIFAPELEEMLGDAPDADAVMEAERNVPINAPDNYYEEDSAPKHTAEKKERVPEIHAAVTEENKSIPEVDPAATQKLLEKTFSMAENVLGAGVAAEEIAKKPEESSRNIAPAADAPPKAAVFDDGKVSTGNGAAPEPENAAVMEAASGEEDAAALERARLMAKIKIPDMEITADTIVPGVVPPDKKPDTNVQAPASGQASGEGDVPLWENTTPKVVGYDQIEISKTVSPMQKQESPFVFIDTE